MFSAHPSLPPCSRLPPPPQPCAHPLIPSYPNTPICPQFGINGYAFCGGNDYLPKLKSDRVYRFHAFNPAGDYYYYFQILQVHDVATVAFRGLPLANIVDSENVTLLSTITDAANTVLWPMQAHEIDIAIPSSGVTASYNGRMVIYDENQESTDQGMQTSMQVVLKSSGGVSLRACELACACVCARVRACLLGAGQLGRAAGRGSGPSVWGLDLTTTTAYRRTNERPALLQQLEKLTSS